MKYVCFAVILLVFPACLLGQLPLGKQDAAWQKLDAKVQRKLERADKMLQKATEYNKKTETFEKQMETLRNDRGRIKNGKIRKLERQRNNAILQSRPFYEDGFKKGYSAYGEQIKLLCKQNPAVAGDVDVLLDKAKDRYKQGRKLYRRADGTGQPQRQTEMIVLGGNKMRESLGAQVEAIRKLGQEREVPSEVAVKPVEGPVVATVKDTVLTVAPVAVTTPAVPAAAVVAPVQTPVSPQQLAAQPAAVAPVAASTPAVGQTVPSAAVAQTTAPSAPTGNVFITIQVMASQAAATQQQIKQVYSGPNEVVELVSGEYHRYVVGRFRTVEQAKELMAAQGIKGLVVAFKGADRISVAEALKELSAGN